MRITVFSTFHNSSVRLNINENQVVTTWGKQAVELTHYQTERADKALCGVSDCACGGVARAIAVDAQGQEYALLS